MKHILITLLAAVLLAACCGDNKEKEMPITVNIKYTGVDGNALKFAEEMVASGTVAALREKYDLHMTVERYTPADQPETDTRYIRK